MAEITSTTADFSVTKLSRNGLRSAVQDLGAPVFVWGIWALMLLAALLYVWTYSANLPLTDDFEYVDVLTGEQSLTVSWLFSPHGGSHREPLPKLILLGLYLLTGDFRAPMFFNVLTVGLLGFAMIWTARGLRGWVSYSDAVFPLTLLHLGHSRNFLWGWLVTLFFPVALACAVLLVIVRGNGQLRLWNALLAGICLLLLPLCGAAGLAVVPPLVLWLAYIAVGYWCSQEPHAKRKGLFIFSLASTAILLAGLYLHGLPPSRVLDPAVHTRTIGSRLWATLQSALMFLPQAFGPRYLAPLEGWLTRKTAQRVMSGGIAGLGLLSMTVLAAISRSRAQERPRALGLLSFLVAMGSLALAIGYGRPGSGGLAIRYAILAVPALLGLYFTCALYLPTTFGFLLRSSLLVYSLIMLLFNSVDGIEYGHNHKKIMVAFESDLRAGVPIFVLSSRYSPFIVRTPANSGWVYDEKKVKEYLTMTSTQVLHDKLENLRRARIGVFRLLRADPAFSEVSLPLASASLHQMSSESAGIVSTGVDPSVVFDLGKTRHVGAIRFKYSHPARGDDPEDSAPEPFLISWKRDGQVDFTEAQSHLSMSKVGLWELGVQSCPAPEKETVTVWVGASVKQFRIHPNQDASARRPRLRISEVALLVPVHGEYAGLAEGDRWPAGTLTSLHGFSGPSGGFRHALALFLRDALSGVQAY